jgi:hypothetical protein
MVWIHSSPKKKYKWAMRYMKRSSISLATVKCWRIYFNISCKAIVLENSLNFCLKKFLVVHF